MSQVPPSLYATRGVQICTNRPLVRGKNQSYQAAITGCVSSMRGVRFGITRSMSSMIRPQAQNASRGAPVGFGSGRTFAGGPMAMVIGENGMRVTRTGLETNLFDSTSMRLYCSKARAKPFSKEVPSTAESITKAAGSETAEPATKAPKPSIKTLFSFAKPEAAKLVAAVALLFVSSAVTVSVPYGVGKVIDMIVDPEHGMEKLRTLSWAIGGVFLVGGLANFGRVYLFQTSSQNIVARLRSRVFRSIMTQETAFFDKNQSGELVNRLSADTQLVGKSITESISDILRNVIQAGAGIGMMAAMSMKLMATVTGVVPVVGLMAMGYGRYVKSLSKRVQDSLAETTQVGQERIANIRTVRAFAKETDEMARFDSKVNDVRKLGHTEALAQGMFFGSTGMTGNFIMLGVLWYGGNMMQTGELTVGNLTSFLLYTVYVAGSVVNLSRCYSDLMRGAGAGERLFELLHRDPKMNFEGGTTIPKEEFKGSLEFENVDFSYESRGDAKVFDGLNLSVPANSVLGVVGGSGSGKSTLGSILFRLYDVNSGTVKIDGRDVRDLDPHWLRSHVGVVSQEPTLFSGSIADNIAYGCDDADVREI
ncbi:hypothetical protein SARC_11779, partial [Sphaeroforma arctica JP610]